ncbi:MAG TPA: MaoC family dehydratase [Enteractinococcus sp.]
MQKEAPMNFGRHYEDFVIGDVYKHWPGKTVTEADNHQFCLLTMNHHPVHLDHEYAANHQGGKPLVVGSYVYSLLLGMSVADVSGAAIANLATDELKHLEPVHHGDTIYGESEVLNARVSASKPDRGIVQVETRGYNQHGTLVCSYRRKVLVPCKQTSDV